MATKGSYMLGTESVTGRHTVNQAYHCCVVFCMRHSSHDSTTNAETAAHHQHLSSSLIVLAATFSNGQGS